MSLFQGALRIVRAVSAEEISGKRLGRKTTGYPRPVFKIITEDRGRKGA